MPAAGMRRTTRVFGMKGADSARVLRSGRRLWPESGEVKTKRGNDGDDWSMAPSKAAKFEAATSPRGAAKGKREEAVVDASAKTIGRRFGIVYQRRRKGLKKEGSRRNEEVWRCALSVVVSRRAGESGRFLRLLASVARYGARVRVSPRRLSGFFMSEAIHGAFASQGMQFVKGPPTVNTGICRFFGFTEFVPLFSVDFSAVPLCFEHLHSAMFLKSMFRSFILVHNPINVHSDVEDIESDDDFPEYQNKLQISSNAFKREPSETATVTSDVIEINDGLSLHSSVKATRVAGRNGQYRNMLNSRGIQKRRSSLRKRKARNPSTMSLRRNGAVASDLMGGRKSNSQLSGVTSSKKLRSLPNGSITGSMKEASSAIVNSKERDSSSCSANLLVSDTDQCYRVEGAIVTLEMSSPREWLLTVKKDGLTRCSFKAEKVMRPCSSNRFTHAAMYSLDNGWKLEFTNRQDWNVFKDLYKKCSDRNIPATAAKFIPVPGVREVSSYADSNSFPFHRPDPYISAFGDELTRAMTRTTANYDMDSEDEEWLKKFNNEFQKHLSEDNFELIIDALEKVYYCNPDDSFDEKSAANGCQDLGSREVVEAVYDYWIRKRKQKRSLLLRVFQGHQAKRAPLIPKPLLRKRRSFKRQPSQFGRGNQPSVLKAFAAEQDALEENAMLRIEEAKANANMSMELAIHKRKRAQSLAQNADLATYKATMLIRIAEAALAAESVDNAAAYFLD
ncbi:Enhancer of polycomb-like 2 [Spatholobus suberectus]|nr:Enhancer of polycomb-like 2 [Spatholobus suberectus]